MQSTTPRRRCHAALLAGTPRVQKGGARAEVPVARASPHIPYGRQTGKGKRGSRDRSRAGAGANFCVDRGMRKSFPARAVQAGWGGVHTWENDLALRRADPGPKWRHCEGRPVSRSLGGARRGSAKRRTGPTRRCVCPRTRRPPFPEAPLLPAACAAYSAAPGRSGGVLWARTRNQPGVRRCGRQECLSGPGSVSPAGRSTRRR